MKGKIQMNNEVAFIPGPFIELRQAEGVGVMAQTSAD